MPLTPEDVRKKTFTPVRLREGYDMTEVDAFLDEVEAELTRLLTDHEARDLPTAEGSPDSGDSTTGTTREHRATEGQQVAVPDASPAQVPELPVVATPAEASNRAARLLEIAAANADQLVEEARREADQLREDARVEVERLTSDAKARAERLDAETSERRHRMLDDLDREREDLSRSIEGLRAREDDCRRRLKTFFEAQLSILDGNGDGRIDVTALGEPETPGRLRELLLGDDA